MNIYLNSGRGKGEPEMLNPSTARRWRKWWEDWVMSKKLCHAHAQTKLIIRAHDHPRGVKLLCCNQTFPRWIDLVMWKVETHRLLLGAGRALAGRMERASQTGFLSDLLLLPLLWFWPLEPMAAAQHIIQNYKNSENFCRFETECWLDLTFYVFTPAQTLLNRCLSLASLPIDGGF